MHPFAMEMAAILVHSLNRFSLCTKMAAVAVAKLLLCCDIICKRSIVSKLLVQALNLTFQLAKESCTQALLLILLVGGLVHENVI